MRSLGYPLKSTVPWFLLFSELCKYQHSPVYISSPPKSLWTVTPSHSLRHWCLSLSSLLFSHSVTSDSLQPHGLQHPRLPRSLPSPGVLKLMSTELVMPSIHPRLPPSPAFSVCQHQGLFQWVSSLHQVASFSISPSSDYSGLISFRMDWLITSVPFLVGCSPCSSSSTAPSAVSWGVCVC